jgi:hypothetical protein
MAVSRPNPDGRFPYPDAERLHTNLRSAFPAYAAAYDQQLAA